MTATYVDAAAPGSIVTLLLLIVAVLAAFTAAGLLIRLAERAERQSMVAGRRVLDAADEMLGDGRG